MAERTVLKYDGFSFADSHLQEIGNAIASLWGASCYDYKVDRTEQAVLFHCIEFGERFITKSGFHELKEYLRRT